MTIHPITPFLSCSRIVPTAWRTSGPVSVVGKRGDCMIEAQRSQVFQKVVRMRGWARDRHSAGMCVDRVKLMVVNDVSSDSDSHASVVWWQCSL